MKQVLQRSIGSRLEVLMRKMIVTRESPILQPLRELIEEQKHRTLVMWALECGKGILPIFETKYPDDKRPREALRAARLWAHGDIKMPIAKKAAHASHNAATEVIDESPSAGAAARAMGHIVGAVHVETHAIGVACYGITAFVYDLPSEEPDAVIEKIVACMYDRLKYWERQIEKLDKEGTRWAPFLLRDEVPNKEKMLREKNKTPKAI